MPKGTQKVVNKIENQNVFEIDYEKLADAIVKAEKKANEDASFTKSTFGGILSLTFRLAAILGALIFVIGEIVSVANFIRIIKVNGMSFDSVALLFLLIMTFLFVGVLAYFFLRSAKEIERESDKQFVVAVFSATTSLAALIVAVVALCK